MRRFLSRKKVFVLAAVVLFPILLYVFRFQELAGIGGFLVIHDKLEPADIIFLLNGDPTVRPYHAAALFAKGSRRRSLSPGRRTPPESSSERTPT